MKAIISPYEPDLNDGSTLVPCVINDTQADYFSSSDMPDTISSEGERLIALSTDKHAEALTLGYVEVEVDSWL